MNFPTLDRWFSSKKEGDDMFSPENSMIAEKIEDLVDKWLDKHYQFQDAVDINSEDCYYFAKNLQKILGEGILVESLQGAGNGELLGHTVLKIGERYYDAEIPFGVKNVSEIPCYRRLGISPDQVVENPSEDDTGTWRDDNQFAYGIGS